MTYDIKLLEPPRNFAVVQMAGRNFPGVVIQGDTLHSLVRRLLEMEKLLEIGDLEELSGEITGTKEELTEALSNYESICFERNLELPYPKQTIR